MATENDDLIGHPDFQSVKEMLVAYKEILEEQEDQTPLLATVVATMKSSTEQ